MAAQDNSGAKPAGPIVLRIKLRYEDIDAMVQRFAPNVGKSGLFLPTKSIQPLGTEVKFELRLANDTPALVGIGKVKHIKPPDPANPKAAFGMAIELMRVSREGREVIIRMIERRRAMGLPDVAIPLPEDTETARRAEVETQPRAETSGIVREAMQQFASAPVSEAVVTSAPKTGPIAVAREPSAPVLTAPRDSGPIRSVAMLAPEPARAKRPRVSDLIAKANELSGPLASVQVPGLDEHVDVDAVLARARVLAAGTDLEAELASLRESAAAPVEISIDAASAELARQLGGNAIAKRDRSARWAPPPAVETKPSPPPVVEEPAAEEFAQKTRAETEASAAAVIASVIDKAVEAAPPPDPAPIEEPAHIEPEHVEPAQPGYEELAPVEARTGSMLIDDNADARSFERAFSDAERLNTGDLEQIDEEDLDEDRGDRTQIGAMPIDPNAFQAHGYPTTPDSSHEQLAEHIDRHLDEAEVEANADVSQGFQAEYPYVQEPPQQYAGNDEEVSDVDVLAEADEGDADLLGADGEGDASREAPAYQDPVPEAIPEEAIPDEAVPEPAYEMQPRQVADSLSNIELPDDQLPPDEFDPEAAAEFDRESAREFDRELRRESQGGMEAQEPEGYAEQPQPYTDQPAYVERQSVSDFAARLDLGDDEPPEAPIAPPPVAYQRQRRPSTDYPDPPSSSYTFAEQFPEAALHPPSTLDRALADAEEGEEFDEPHSYAQQQPYAPPPQPPQPPLQAMHYEPPTARPQAFEEPPKRETAEDLEDALQALDVDLGDVNERVRRPPPTGQRPLPGLPIQRPTTGQVPLAPKVATGPVRTVAHTVKRAQTKPPTTPPPPPAAAFRKTPTQQVPVSPPQPQNRAPTDDGIVIDFDDDE